MKKDGWFLIELIFRIHSPQDKAATTFDNRMKLIKAASAREAYQTTLVLASREIDNQNIEQASFLWEFAGIGIFEMINEPKEIENPAVKYVIPNEAAALDYLQSLRHRNALLQTQIAISA